MATISERIRLFSSDAAAVVGSKRGSLSAPPPIKIKTHSDVSVASHLSTDSSSSGGSTTQGEEPHRAHSPVLDRVLCIGNTMSSSRSSVSAAAGEQQLPSVHQLAKRLSVSTPSIAECDAGNTSNSSSGPGAPPEQTLGGKAPIPDVAASNRRLDVSFSPRICRLAGACSRQACAAWPPPPPACTRGNGRSQACKYQNRTVGVVTPCSARDQQGEQRSDCKEHAPEGVHSGRRSQRPVLHRAQGDGAKPVRGEPPTNCSTDGSRGQTRGRRQAPRERAQHAQGPDAHARH